MSRLRPHSFARWFTFAAALTGGSLLSFAFLPPVDSDGPLTVSIADPGEVKSLAEPLHIKVTVANSGSQELPGDVVLSVIDDWRIAGDQNKQSFALKPHTSQVLSFDVLPGPKSYAALYPVHAWAEAGQGAGKLHAHAVLITTVAASAVATRPFSAPQSPLASTIPPKLETDAQRLERRHEAVAQARGTLQGRSSDWSWKLESTAGTFGVSVVPGPCGLADACIVFADERRELVFTGYTVQVDGQALGNGPADLRCLRVEKSFRNGSGDITCYITHKGSLTPLRARVWSEKGALRIAFSMPGVRRDRLGEPRYTKLAIGAASELAHRVYAGFGNVLQDPGAFDLGASGFSLSTRHVGADFANGLSLVQASDIFPDDFHVDPSQHAYSLVVPHDATFSLIPSAHGAFAGARVYHDLVDFQPAGGVRNLLGRMCLDQWGGDYKKAAEDIESAARYGLTDAVFVKHVWQHNGYDYRLPDVYPPQGNWNDFQAMVAACKTNGILFCPHDNYIDFYPDASGFSYSKIVFDPDGTPEKAWFNAGAKAQSYRWSPNEFMPRLEANLRQIKAGFSPTAYFLDVFGSLRPMDFFDQEGQFYPKTVTVERWGAAFDRIREILGHDAPTISEAGQDALIGHLDGGQSDHCGWKPWLSDDVPFHWGMTAADGERVPWHDMASHGSFVLFAGGLGPRYAVGEDEMLHGFGSDDYLSVTVLGGRNPMCDGPFSRRTVMTYWLLHDVCASLARREMLADEFSGDDIHRQAVTFSSGAVVKVNRGKSDWTVDGQVLPPYGFIAKAGGNEAGITRRDGVISAYAKSPRVLFVDARPKPAGDASAQESSTDPRDPAGRAARINEQNKPLDFGAVVTNGSFRLSYQGSQWQLIPLPDSASFSVELRLDQLNAKARKVLKVFKANASGETTPVDFRQAGDDLQFDGEPSVFAYRIQVEG